MDFVNKSGIREVEKKISGNQREEKEMAILKEEGKKRTLKKRWWWEELQVPNGSDKFFFLRLCVQQRDKRGVWEKFFLKKSTLEAETAEHKSVE